MAAVKITVLVADNIVRSLPYGVRTRHK
jgi:hypothetical protein